MPDWQEHVERHLQSLGVSGEREEEIGAELAEHLEDTYQGALRRGLSEEAAMAHAQEQVPNWQKLAGKLRRASREEEDMNDRVRRVWLPGAVMVGLAYGLWWVLLRAGLEPRVVWLGPTKLMFFFLPWLAMLPVIGAMGGYWSRRNGGSARETLLTGMFPAVVLGAFLLFAMVFSVFGDWHVPLAIKLAQGVLYLGCLAVVPGMALALGALPFLRGRAGA